jgi:hypothetical protein
MVEGGIPILAIGHVFFGSRRSLVLCITFSSKLYKQHKYENQWRSLCSTVYAQCRKSMFMYVHSFLCKLSMGCEQGVTTRCRLYLAWPIAPSYMNPFLPPIRWASGFSFSVFFCVDGRANLRGRGAGRGAKSLGEKAWSSVNYSILSDRGSVTFLYLVTVNSMSKYIDISEVTVIKNI